MSIPDKDRSDTRRSWLSKFAAVLILLTVVPMTLGWLALPQDTAGTLLFEIDATRQEWLTLYLWVALRAVVSEGALAVAATMLLRGHASRTSAGFLIGMGTFWATYNLISIVVLWFAAPPYLAIGAWLRAASGIALFVSVGLLLSAVSRIPNDQIRWPSGARTALALAVALVILAPVLRGLAIAFSNAGNFRYAFLLEFLVVAVALLVLGVQQTPPRQLSAGLLLGIGANLMVRSPAELTSAIHEHLVAGAAGIAVIVASVALITTGIQLHLARPERAGEPHERLVQGEATPPP